MMIFAAKSFREKIDDSTLLLVTFGSGWEKLPVIVSLFDITVINDGSSAAVLHNPSRSDLTSISEESDLRSDPYSTFRGTSGC